MISRFEYQGLKSVCHADMTKLQCMGKKGKAEKGT